MMHFPSFLENWLILSLPVSFDNMQPATASTSSCVNFQGQIWGPLFFLYTTFSESWVIPITLIFFHYLNFSQVWYVKSTPFSQVQLSFLSLIPDTLWPLKNWPQTNFIIFPPSFHFAVRDHIQTNFLSRLPYLC